MVLHDWSQVRGITAEKNLATILLKTIPYGASLSIWYLLLYRAQDRWTICRRRSVLCETPALRLPTRSSPHRCAVLHVAQCWPACTYTIISRTPTTTTVRPCSGDAPTNHAASPSTYTLPDTAPVRQALKHICVNTFCVCFILATFLTTFLTTFFYF